MDDVGLALALVPTVGIACLWLAARLNIPAILLLLPAGVVLGPATNLVEPRELFGEAFFPGISVAVAILLFEGGLELRLDEVGGTKNIVLRLVTLGVGITFAIGALVGPLLFDAPSEVLLVLAAVLTVSGPTVVGPILRQVRPREPTRSVLQWEGIVIDPVGATLAIAVLELVVAQQRGAESAVLDLLITTVAGVSVGVAVAWTLTRSLRHHLVPDRLQAVVSFGMVIAAYAIAESLYHEAGLFATTVMGVWLANQRKVTIAHIASFNEVIGQLLLAGLFIVLGANVDPDALAHVALPALGLTLVLVLVARPLAVWISTVGSDLVLRDKAFMAWMAPRGIVAAAVSALFALRLEEEGVAAEDLAPATFVVIVATVTLYGLTAKPVAAWLRVAKAQPKGMALIGAPRWALGFADELYRNDVPVLVVTTDDLEAREATHDGLLVFSGRLDYDELAEAVDAVGVRQVVTAANSAELNELGAERLADLVGRANVFTVPNDANEAPRTTGRNRSVTARRAFSKEVDRRKLSARHQAGWRFATLPTEGELDLAKTLPLVHLLADGTPSIVSDGTRKRFQGGRIIALVAPEIEREPTDEAPAPRPTPAG